MHRIWYGFIGLGICFVATATYARDQIVIVGSSTVYPFSTVVAEEFHSQSGQPTPKVESVGTGGGFKLFCDGVGDKFPDIANASRQIKQSERDLCAKNGVQDIIEVPFGFDGIVIANLKGSPPINLSRQQLFLALAAKVPDAAGKQLIANPYKTWKDIDPSLPNEKIEVLGPPPTSGTRDAFVELVMEKACQDFDLIKNLKDDERKAVCGSVRTDGAYIDTGENDNLIVQKLETNPKAFGIFGFSFLDQNNDKIQAITIENVPATFENIASGQYPISRSLFFYVKKAHLKSVPGLADYTKEFISDSAVGDNGYLLAKGVIPLTKEQLSDIKEKVEQALQ